MFYKCTGNDVNELAAGIEADSCRKRKIYKKAHKNSDQRKLVFWTFFCYFLFVAL